MPPCPSFPLRCHSTMSLATFFKAGMLPICAIIISLAPFATFSQPQMLLPAQNYTTNASPNTISYTPFIKNPMMNASISIADFYVWSESGRSVILYHQDSDKQRADQAISSLGIRVKPKSWMLPKGASIETKEGVEEEENDAMWDIVTRKENGIV